MTPQEQKELAEFGAEFLKAHFPDVMKSWQRPKDFFEIASNASYRAHLAKREMEKRGFGWMLTGNPKEKYYASFDRFKEPCEKCQGQDIDVDVKAEHENEYIALWLAIREAVK